MYHYFVA